MPVQPQTIVQRLVAATGGVLLALAVASTTNLPPTRLDVHSLPRVQAASPAHMAPEWRRRRPWAAHPHFATQARAQRGLPGAALQRFLCPVLECRRRHGVHVSPINWPVATRMRRHRKILI